MIKRLLIELIFGVLSNFGLVNVICFGIDVLFVGVVVVGMDIIFKTEESDVKLDIGFDVRWLEFWFMVDVLVVVVVFFFIRCGNRGVCLKYMMLDLDFFMMLGIVW